MQNGPFVPQGKTYLVAAAAVQIVAAVPCQTYRIRNLAAAVQYLTWGTTAGVTSVGAPGAGTPSANTLGFAAGATETVELGGNWMIASSATGFEVTPGEGMT